MNHRDYYLAELRAATEARDSLRITNLLVAAYTRRFDGREDVLTYGLAKQPDALGLDALTKAFNAVESGRPVGKGCEAYRLEAPRHAVPESEHNFDHWSVYLSLREWAERERAAGGPCVRSVGLPVDCYFLFVDVPISHAAAEAAWAELTALKDDDLPEGVEARLLLYARRVVRYGVPRTYSPTEADRAFFEREVAAAAEIEANRNRWITIAGFRAALSNFYLPE